MTRRQQTIAGAAAGAVAGAALVVVMKSKKAKPRTHRLKLLGRNLLSAVDPVVRLLGKPL